MKRMHRLLLAGIGMSLLIGVPAANAQWISAVPRAQFGGYPQTFFDACNNLSQWSTVKPVTAFLGSFAGDLYSADDATLSACLYTLNTNGLQLTVEAAAFQPAPTPGGCGSGVDCFNWLSPLITRLKDLGAGVIHIRLQEPLTVGRMAGWQPNDIVNQTVIFMQLIRQSYTNIEFTSVEAYPYNSASLLNWWMVAVRNTCVDVGIPAPTAFEVDHDTNAGGTFSDLISMRDQAHAVGYSFNYIFGSPVPPGGAENWHTHALNQGAGIWYSAVQPDIYTFESWESSDPWFTIPEDASGTFTYTVKTFRQQGFFPR